MAPLALLVLSCLCALSHSFPDNKPIAVHGQSSNPVRWNWPAPWKQSDRYNQRGGGQWFNQWRRSVQSKKHPRQLPQLPKRVEDEKARADRIRVEKLRVDKMRGDLVGNNKSRWSAHNPALKANPMGPHPKNKPGKKIANSNAAAKKVNRPTEINESDAVIIHVPSVPAAPANQESVDNMVKQYLEQLGNLYRKQQREAELQGVKHSDSSEQESGLDGREAVEEIAQQKGFKLIPDSGKNLQYYDYFKNILSAEQYQGELQKAIASGEPVEDYVTAAYWRLLSDYYLGTRKQTESKFTQGNFAASFHEMLEEDPELKQAYYKQLFGRSV